jgi:uncharacterized membrane protein
MAHMGKVFDIRNWRGTNQVSKMSEAERWISIIGGSALALYSLQKRSAATTPIAVAGGYLIFRGATGQCPVSEKLSIGREAAPIRVQRSVVIERTPEELFAFWRKFENLPLFMKHLESAVELGSGRSSWKTKAPFGMRFEWEAEITEEVPDRRIAWQSVEGSQVENSGRVEFIPAAGNRGTELRTEIEYLPPAGKIGRAFAMLFGEDPEQQVREDLRRFKQLMEAGEIATTDGQPSGRRSKVINIMQKMAGKERPLEMRQRAAQQAKPTPPDDTYMGAGGP